MQAQAQSHVLHPTLQPPLELFRPLIERAKWVRGCKGEGMEGGSGIGANDMRMPPHVLCGWVCEA